MGREVEVEGIISRLGAAISATDTSLTVDTGGSAFPTSNFQVLVGGEGGEVVLVGSRSGNTFSSLTRAQEGTLALARPAGSSVELVVGGETIRTSGGGSVPVTEYAVDFAFDTPGISPGGFTSDVVIPAGTYIYGILWSFPTAWNVADATVGVGMSLTGLNAGLDLDGRSATTADDTGTLPGIAILPGNFFGSAYKVTSDAAVCVAVWATGPSDPGATAGIGRVILLTVKP